MTQSLDIIERAFQLATECGGVNEIKLKLKAEGYSNVDAHLEGRSIRSDLKRLFKR